MDKVTSFEDDVAVREYAVANDMAYAWEGTSAFVKRASGLRPEQYQVVPVATRRGITNVLLFSNDVLRAEDEADKPRQDALAAKRAKWRARRGF